MEGRVGQARCRDPGDAEKVKAAADAEARKHQADGEAYAQRTVAAAEAEAINVRAASLADGNQALIAANKLIDVLPSLVAEAAKGISGSNLTILNGTDGVNQVAAGVVSQGLSIYEALRKSVATTKVPAADAEVTDIPAISASNGNAEKAGQPDPLH